jgi:DNA-binding Lrp family transcriptional regulator
MLANPDVTSLNISKKLKLPLSTIQRRRTALERSSIVRKSYELDAKQFGWRTADLLICVEKGDCMEIANRLLAENLGIKLTSDFSKKINRGDMPLDGVRIMEASVRMGDPVINVMVRILYRSSEDLFNTVQTIKGLPNVVRVEWAEIVKVIGRRNNAPILPPSDSRVYSKFNLDR